MVTFANAKNRIEGMSNLLGNIAEAKGALEEEEKKSSIPSEIVILKPSIKKITATTHQKPPQNTVQKANPQQARPGIH